MQSGCPEECILHFREVPSVRHVRTMAVNSSASCQMKCGGYMWHMQRVAACVPHLICPHHAIHYRGWLACFGGNHVGCLPHIVLPGVEGLSQIRWYALGLGGELVAAPCLQLASTGHLAAHLVCTQHNFAVWSCQDDIAVPAHLHASLPAAPPPATDHQTCYSLYCSREYKL